MKDYIEAISQVNLIDLKYDKMGKQGLCQINQPGRVEKVYFHKIAQFGENC